MAQKNIISFILMLCLSINSCYADFFYHPKNQNISTTTIVPEKTSPSNSTPASPGMVESIEQRLVSYVHETVESLRYTAYRLGGQHFDTAKGIYVVDCSSYVDHILANVCPKAFFKLANSTGTGNPTSRDYYQFFNQLPAASNHYWNKINSVKQLEPGDILVFRTNVAENAKKKKKHHKKTIAAAGHVMIIMSKPLINANGFTVQVADSASSGHSHDTRMPHESGIGIGTLLLKVDLKTGRPYAYAWKVNSYWKKNVRFAMARPTEPLRSGLLTNG